MGRDLSFLLPELVLAATAMLMIVAEMARAARLVLAIGLLVDDAIVVTENAQPCCPTSAAFAGSRLSWSPGLPG
jgi:Cu/Ag efflux pump CusA